jgi:Cu/Ag efflux protein CusF
MQRMRLGVVGGVVLMAIACAGSGRASRATSGESPGTPVANAAAAAGTAASASAQEAGREGAARQVEGRVEIIDRGNDVTLSGTESVGHAFDKMKLDESTRVTVNGQRATIADVEEGDDVRATFSAKDGELHLDQIEVLPQGE